MLVLGFVQMCPLMLDLFSTGASVAEVCFLCLEVFCFKWLIMEGLMLYAFLLLFSSARRTLLTNFATFSIWNCQQRVLKKFPGLGYLYSEDGVVLWLCQFSVKYILYIYNFNFHAYMPFYLTMSENMTIDIDKASENNTCFFLHSYII